MINLNESSCDLKNPIWLSNSARIEDRNLLPVTGVRYGPHTYELFKANITIMPLQCQPASEEDPFNAKVEFEGLEEKVNEIVLNLEQNNGNDQNLIQRVVELEETNITIHDTIEKLFACPEATDSKYKRFGLTCYYFEAGKKNFAEAQENCATKFETIGGKLAEPQTAERSKELNIYAEEILSSTYYWIGYDCLGHGEGNFRYSSTNTVSNIESFSGNGNVNGLNNEHCAAFIWKDSSNIGNVDDKLCANSYSSICETKK